MKKHFCLFTTISFLSLFQNRSVAQNLIPNAGFEYKKSCPNKTNCDASLAIGWFNATKASPEYYHTCGKEGYRTPKNKYNKILPIDGKAYIGLYYFSNYMEYIETRLKEPLEPGVTYEVNLYAISSDVFNYLTSDIGLYFSNKRLLVKGTKQIKNIKPQIISPKDSILSPYDWTEIKGTFVAKGGEKYVTIGSFLNTPKMLKISEKEYCTKSAYLFIDNISTAAIKRPKQKLPAKGKIMELDFVYFLFDKSELLPSSHKGLNQLSDILKLNDSIKIEIIGHTDNLGTKEYNKILSERRANAVADYLVQSGIHKDRIKYKGLGSSSPKVENETEKGKQLNRRVEFRVTE